MGARRAPLLQARQELRDLPRRPHVPPRAARAAHRHLSRSKLSRKTQFSVGAFNAHWGVGRFGVARYHTFDVAAAVRSFNCDVVCVAEAYRDRDGISSLESLEARGYTVETFPFVGLGLEPRPNVVDGSGMWELALCTRLPVLARRELPIGRVYGDPVRGPRHALAVTVDVGGTPVEVIALHTSSRLLWGGPIRHLRGLRPHLATDRPMVVAGDCNLWGPFVTRLLPGFERAVRGRTYPVYRPHSQIDHVLVNRHVESLGGAVYPATLSDHLPIVADLQLAARPGEEKKRSHGWRSEIRRGE